MWHKVLVDKAFTIPKNLKYDGYHSVLSSMISKVFDKKSFGGVATRQRPVTLDKSTVKSENMPKQQLAEESCKSIILVKFGKL